MSLQAATAASQNVIVCSHLPLYPDTCPPACLLWNYEAVLDLLHTTDVVVATIAGHTHQNGYLVDDHNIHHLVMPAVLETPPGRDAYGHMEIHQDRILLKGIDTCMSCELILQPAAVQRQQQVLQRLSAGVNCSSSSRELGVVKSTAAERGVVDVVIEVADEQLLEKTVCTAAEQAASHSIAAHLVRSA